jgi:malate dehydrogenase (quinone)
VNIILEVIKKCFPHLLASPEGHSRMKEMIPTYDENLKDPENAARFQEISQRADELLGLRRA